MVILVEINILRREERTSPSNAAVELLLQMRDLPIQAMIDTNTQFKSEWSYIIRIYFASMVIYATNTLSSMTLPSWTKDFASTQRDTLFALLLEAYELPVLRASLLWPSMMAGFEAATGTAAERASIDKLLTTIGQKAGDAAPFHGQAVLKRFWRSGKSGWDDCFDDIYCFIH